MRSDIGLWVLAILSMAVACGGVYVANDAAGKLQARQKECLELAEKFRRSEAEVDLLRPPPSRRLARPARSPARRGTIST